MFVCIMYIPHYVCMYHVMFVCIMYIPHYVCMYHVYTILFVCIMYCIYHLMLVCIMYIPYYVLYVSYTFSYVGILSPPSLLPPSFFYLYLSTRPLQTHTAPSQPIWKHVGRSLL